MVRLLLDIGPPLPCQLLSNLPIDVSVQWHFVDCSDIHQVFHYGPPSSPEEYVQEIGRAGQDGGHMLCKTWKICRKGD